MANNTTSIQKDIRLDQEVYDVDKIKNALSDTTELDPDEMTERDVATRINKLLAILKGTLCVAMSIFLIGAIPVSPTGVQTNIAASKNDIPGKTLLYTADAVEIRLKNNYTKSEVDALFEDSYEKVEALIRAEFDAQFGDYYTKEEIIFKFSEYYTGAETDAKIQNAVGTGQITLDVDGKIAGTFNVNQSNDQTIMIQTNTGDIAPKRYPLFIIDLNTDIQNLAYEQDENGFVKNLDVNDDDPNSMSMWTSFELKASTNNFLHAEMTSYLIVTNDDGTVFATITNTVPSLEEDDRVLFWCCSEASDGFDGSDSMRKYSCDTRFGIDVRSWTFYDTSADLANKQPAKVAVILDPPMFKHTPDNSWCNDQNEELVWSYIRNSNSGHEKDVNGKNVWHPVQPVKWFSQLPKWAYKSGENRRISKEDFLNTQNKEIKK